MSSLVQSDAVQSDAGACRNHQERSSHSNARPRNMLRGSTSAFHTLRFSENKRSHCPSVSYPRHSRQSNTTSQPKHINLSLKAHGSSLTFPCPPCIRLGGHLASDKSLVVLHPAQARKTRSFVLSHPPISPISPISPILATRQDLIVETSKLAGLHFVGYSFIQPLLGPKFRVFLGGDLRPP